MMGSVLAALTAESGESGTGVSGLKLPLVCGRGLSAITGAVGEVADFEGVRGCDCNGNAGNGPVGGGPALGAVLGRDTLGARSITLMDFGRCGRCRSCSGLSVGAVLKGFIRLTENRFALFFVLAALDGLVSRSTVSIDRFAKAVSAFWPAKRLRLLRYEPTFGFGTSGGTSTGGAAGPI